MEKELYKLTNPQKSIWYTENFFENSNINNICTSGIIYENINIEALKKALFILVQDNDSFRIKLTLKNDTPMQYISDFAPFDIETIYVNSIEDFKNIEQKMVNEKFNIFNSSLFKFKIAIFPDNSAGVILNIHHIIADSWSLGLTIQKIVQIYHSIKKGEKISTQGSSYIDYIKKEQEYKQSSKYIDDKSYWNKAFDSIPEIATIPSINDKKGMSSSYNANRSIFNIEPMLLNKIRIFCKENHLSFFNFFISIFAIYINRVSNVDDFVIGSTILNRTSITDKLSTGMFVNTVPIRFNFINNTSFDSFAKTVSKNVIGILRHQKYSYNSILEDIRSKYSNAPNLYNIMFSYQLTKAYDKSIGNYKTYWGFNNCSANDIAVHIYDINDTGTMEFNYDYLTSKYSKQEIFDIHKRIIHIISQIVENYNIDLKDIDIVTIEEKNKILYDFNNTSTEYPKNKTIVELFEEQVIQTPDNIAIVFEDQKLTYKELNEKANSLAHFLRFEKNITRNEFVGIMVNRSLEMIISILAVLKSGAAYIPIDPTYPKDRIDYMLKNSNAKILLTQNNLNNKINFNNIIFVDLSNNDIYNTFKSNNLEHINKSNDTSYVIFTSGSTGNPKGVVLNHKALSNLTNYCNHYIEYLKTPSNMAIVSITTVSFDIFIFETLISLQKGLKLIIANENEQNSPYLLNNLIQKYDIKIIQSTPSRMQTFLNNKEEIPYFSNLEYITLAGEQLPLKLVQDLTNLCGATIYNGYGPSETTVFSTLTRMNTTKITIGKPLDNTQIYILDTNLNVLPIGISGELYISGDGVGKGYLNNKELTDKSFINNPFINNSIMYKTGDIGYFTPNGNIICLGRSDNQVKLRGLRIELGEIENKINSLSFINSCAVIKQSNNSHEYLCAYFTSHIKVNIKDIEKYLEQFLPKYMIPKYFMQMEELPYTPNGKIDRKALSKINHISKKTVSEKPRNNYDIRLIEILKNILHIENISINDDFLDLGGDSLSAITLSSYIQREFKVQIYVKDILNNSKICELSDCIANHTLSTQITIKPASKSNYYNVSSAQKRIYFASQMDGDNSILYNIPGGIIFDKELDLEKLEYCINTLIKRQESLRTYFELKNKNVVQKIRENVDFKLDVINNASFNDLDTIFKNFVKPFDLSEAPLFRVKYLKFTNNKNAIFIDMHHIISDGTSLSIFIDEIIKLYNGVTLPNLSIQYKDYATYEYEKIKLEQFKKDKTYWLKQFQDEIPVLNMPTQFSRPAIRSFTGNKVYSLINEQTSIKIKNLCNTLEITPYMLLLACYYILLSKYTSQDDIIIGSPIVGRELAETYNIIGMFANTLALRNKIDSSLTFKNFVLNVKENLLDAFKHQTYPYDELVKDLNITRDTSRNPLFDTMFTYQNNGYKEIAINHSTAKYYIPDTKISKFDLSIEAVPQNNTIALTFEYATSLFTEDFIENMSNHYLNILNNVLNNVAIKLKDIDILSKEEKNKILYDFNNTSTEYPKNKTIVELFEEQVIQTPDNIAIVFEDQKLTYKELNEKANSLAHFLRFEKNITRNEFVGIMVNRSLEMIISILAVLKSGAAYIPIDPAYPKDRIDYMLNNSNAKLLLTQESLKNKLNYENIVLVDLTKEDIYSLESQNLEHINTQEDTSYVIFTSGSTGNPKGVVLNHKALSNLTNYCNHYIEYLKTPSNMAIVSITTVSFDIFIFETLISLQKGLKLIIANENEQNSPYLLNNLIQKYDIKIIQSTPSRMQTFLNNKEEIPYFSNLEYITLAGEQLPLKLVQDLTNLCGATIYNGYGPSETTVFSTLTRMNTTKITIGKPLDNTQIYILDTNLNVLPIGIIGELYISGDGVGKGYLNNKELTDKSFINNPFINNSIMYKTGDIGYFTPNGDIICLGRSDNQIKLRGLRIELGEIENVAEQYPQISKCIVIKNSLNNKDFLTCYYTSLSKINTNNLKQYISNYLPKYMIPSYFVVMENFPYTPNGKVDKKNLPLPQDFVHLNKKSYVPPETYLQKKLVNVFESILNITPIGIDDNFFELGGDSLLAMNLNMEILKISNKISYQDIFNNPTVCELEEKIISLNSSSMFSKIENLSEKHLRVLKNSNKKVKITKNNFKGILLTGATGFLGIHILKEFIDNSSSNIYCIVRSSRNISAQKRLKQKLIYYFGKDYNELFDKRIFVIQGDISQNDLGLNKFEIKNISDSIDVVINSAAIVSHFGIYEKMYNANVKSIKNIIEFCKSYNKKLYHISTISVSGSDLDTSYLIYNTKHNLRRKIKKVKFDETTLYIGQNLDNIYIRTKFEAENTLLAEISTGLDAYILRIGNLMHRYSDGVFQENILDNKLINNLISFIKLGIIPDYLLNLPISLTPVDDAAKSIYKLVNNSSDYHRIFHISNPNTITMKKLIHVLSQYGISVDTTSEENFKNIIKKMINDPDKKDIIKNLLYDFDAKLHINYSKQIHLSTKITIKYLKKLGFKWHKNTKSYLIKIIESIMEEI